MNKLIEIEGITWQVSLMLDEDREVTNDPSEVCHLLIQRPEDIRPHGVKQPFSAIQIVKGSFEIERAN